MSNSSVQKIIYLVRHGQSVGNITPVFQSPDSSLSIDGKQQAQDVASRISRLSFDALIASPLQRARETAEIIKKVTGKKIEYSDLFVERVKPTSIHGKSYYDDVVNVTWKAWEESLYTPNVRVEDGENFDDLILRADKALTFLEKRRETTLVVVTHGFFIRTIVARVLLGDFLSPEVFRYVQGKINSENTGITVLQYRGDNDEVPSWCLRVYNDHAHLG